MKTWSHIALLKDLQQHRKSPATITFSEVGVGSRWLQGSIPVPDLLTMEKSYTNPKVTIYEVKSSLGDLRNEVMTKKWTRYLPMCDYFLFALPAGMEYQKLLEPHTQVGIVVRGDSGWRTIRRSNKSHRENFTDLQWFSLLFSLSNQTEEQLAERNELIIKEEYLLSLKQIEKDIHSFHSILDEKLEAKRDEIIGRERQIRIKENHIEGAVYKKIMTAMGVTSYQPDFDSLIDNMISEPMKQVMRDGIDKLMEYVKEQEVKHGKTP